jgi:predicted Zn-dependent protease
MYKFREKIRFFLAHKSCKKASLTASILLLAVFSPSSHSADIKLPLLGDSSSGIVSKQQEYKLGKSWLQAFRRHVELHDDPILQSYLEQLSYDLVAHSDLEDTRLTVVVVNNPTINAFAVPGGVIGIHTGIFTYADNEDQLSSIIAHEIAHLSQRHFARSMEAQRSASAISLAGLLATIVVSSQADTDAAIATLTTAQALSADQQLRYSRNNEQEADRLGVRIMTRAGKDPGASADMLNNMLALSRYKGNRPPEFLLTHPVTERRVADTRARTISAATRHYPENSNYYLMQARAAVLVHDDAKFSVKYFQQKIDSNSLQTKAAKYGLALAYSNLGDHKKARKILASLLSKDPMNSLFTYTDIENDIAAQEYNIALSKLEYQLKLNGKNYPLQVLLAETLWQSKQYSASAKVLTQLSHQRKEDPAIWYKLAEVRGLAGDISGVHRARAEYFILVGAFERAKKQLTLATKLLAYDFKQVSIIKQRLIEIEQMEKTLRRL